MTQDFSWKGVLFNLKVIQEQGDIWCESPRESSKSLSDTREGSLGRYFLISG